MEKTMKINKQAHSKQLNLGFLMDRIEELKKQYPDNWKDIPVYIGDDDELNGIHCAWYVNQVDGEGDDEGYFRETINEECSCVCIPLGPDETAMLIS